MRRIHAIQLVLLIVTFITTTLAGAEWSTGKFVVLDEFNLTWDDILLGLNYSIPFLGILTVHEFGHYFAAQYHRVATTLPYYIPLWLGFAGVPLMIGTMGAVIRIKGPIKSRRQFFDIGVAGPLAGFVVAFFVLLYGFVTLPPADYIYEIHPEYRYLGADYSKIVYETDTIIATNQLGMPDELREQLGDSLYFSPQFLITMGSTPLFDFFKEHVADPERVPNNHEIFHYPWLFAGFLALFFTALNLLPIGQLDGGHVIYGLFGARYHRIIARILFIAFVFYAGLGLPTLQLYSESPLWFFGYLLFLYLVFHQVGRTWVESLMVGVLVFGTQFFLAYFFPELQGYYGWLLFAFLIGRLLGVDHPTTKDERPLTLKQKVIGWVALVVFILSFSPAPLYIG